MASILKYLRIAVLTACVLLLGLSLMVQGYSVDPVGWVLRAFELLLILTLVVIPILRENSWRFSVRTLLIATTLVAVALGIIMAAQ